MKQKILGYAAFTFLAVFFASSVMAAECELQQAQVIGKIVASESQLERMCVVRVEVEMANQHIFCPVLDTRLLEEFTVPVNLPTSEDLSCEQIMGRTVSGVLEVRASGADGSLNYSLDGGL